MLSNLFKFFVLSFLSITFVNAEQANNNAVTALYLVSSPGDYIGQGESNIYRQGEEGSFSIECLNQNQGVTLTFNGLESSNWWRISFISANNEPMQTGIYKNARRYPFQEPTQPGFTFSGSGRGCNTSFSEFEILELEYNPDGSIESFAATFIQRCEKNGTPLFGSIRYNSSIAPEARFANLSQNSAIMETVLYLKKYNLNTDEETQTTLLSDKEGTFAFKTLPYGEDGFELVVDAGDKGQWVLDFSAPLGKHFKKKHYPNAERYPFNSVDVAGIDILSPSGGFSRPKGEFKVQEFSRSKKSYKIKTLSLNFKVQNQNGEILEGAIRYKSEIPVNLDQPYTD